MKKSKTMKNILTFFAVTLSVTAFITACSDGNESPASNPAAENQNKVTEETYDDSALTAATLWVVGDSTVCDYTKEDGTLTDATYFYPRYGYATQLENFLSSKITVKNLALSGRSSKSFLTEDNYTTLKNGIKAGDFLIVGFGHNDQKSDDADRFASAEESTDTEGSFKYNLYNYYAKLALDAGATPILCSPIVRLNKNSDFTGTYAHITSTGDYGKAVIELGTEKGIQTVDLTSLTKELYTSLGYDEAIYFHAMTSGVSADEPKLESVDSTHINIYGAKKVSWLIAKTIKDSTCALQPYVKSTAEPSKDSDLVKNPDYVYVAYSAVDWSSYSPAEQFKTTTSGWYGTAFGDTGGAPATASNGYYATETSSGVFKVGQTGTTSPKGKIANSSVGVAFLFKQISVSRNFTLTGSANVLATADKNQAGFGLMLRDDCYEPANDKSILSNFVAASLYCDTTSSVKFNMKFENGLTAGSGGLSALYAADDTATFTIKRLGQVVTVTTVYKGETYTETYTDFDFVAKDNDYFYAGFFATRGTCIEVSDVTFTDDGESQGA
ncbi:SGNH/GDSL hydrolase family protein [Treponema sp.]|uniref:SGNH/GDSL hydrolase family protein n=1 Tax=Treponema sp. TaxID=166 RepID=UPI00388E22C8